MDAGTLVNLTQNIEDNESLDGPVQALEPKIRAVFGSGARAGVLRGDWLGHALHPSMTDVVLGTWTSATVLDLFGGRDSAPAAQRLVGTGLLAFAPTAWTGWAQWLGADDAGKRVGVVHAVANGVGAGIYYASWSARRRGHRASGIALALAGAAVSGGAAYLGGHLAEARNAGSHAAEDSGSA
ncbi:MAG TPA: hypothetical protein VF426_10555 [Marmoricola sp.]